MTTIITGTNGPVYQFPSVPTMYGPWNQLVHLDTTPHHIHFGHSMYYLNYPSIYNNYRRLI